MKPPEVFISYAWQGESETIAEEVEQELKKRRLTVIRDKSLLGYTGRIKAFMERLGQGQYIVLVISDRYLKSENCLFELLHIYRGDNFTGRIFPLVLADARISKAKDRLDYAHYWEQEIDQLETKIKAGSPANLHSIYEDLNLYSEIRQDIDRLTAILKDINALTIEAHREKGYDELFRAIMTKYRQDNGLKQIKILALTASPEDGQGLRYELEQDLLLESFKDFNRQEVFLDMPDPVKSTLEEIAEGLAADRHDILLISAHGGIEQGQGFLALEDKDGNEKKVTGQELAAVLLGRTSPSVPFSTVEKGLGDEVFQGHSGPHPGLRPTPALPVNGEGEALPPSTGGIRGAYTGALPKILILSACHTASPKAELMPVAQALFKAGIKTVIGMNRAISDEAAIVFNIAFFIGLNDNQTVKEAFQSGRQAIEKYEQERLKNNPQYKYQNEAAIPQLLTGDENLTRKDFNDHVIEAPPPPQSHQFLGAQYRERGFIGRRQVLRQIYRQIEEQKGALVLKGPGGIGKSTLTTRLAGQLRRRDYDFIVIQGQTSEAAILEALAKKAGQLGVKEAADVSRANAASKDKLGWFLENFFPGHRLLVIFDNFESNQLEAQAGEFQDLSLKEFLRFWQKCLAGHESLLLFSSRYAVPGIDCLDIPEFSAIEFRKMVWNSRALGRLDGESMEALRLRIGGNPRAIELLDKIAGEEFGSREFTWEKLTALFPEAEGRLLQEHDKDDDFAPLFLGRLLTYLEAGQRRLLDVAAIFRLPVADGALRALGVGTGRPDKKRLIDLSLLECRAAAGFYYVHRLTAAYVLAGLNADTQKGYHRAAAGYFSEIFDLENKGNVDDGIEARWHYLQAEAWDQAAEITFSLEDFLTLHGYPFQSMDLLQEIAARPLDEENRAIALGQMAILYQGFGQYDQAIALYLQVKDIFDGLGDQRNVAASLHQVGMIYEERGDYDAALGQYQKSLAIKEKIGDIAGVAKSLHQVGMIYEKRGDYDAALDQYQKALKTFEEIGDIKNAAACLHQVGMIYQMKGDYDAALEQYQKSLAIKEKIGDIKGAALSLWGIGNVYLDKGDYDNALEEYQKALKTFEKIGDIKNVAGCLHQVGMIYQERGEYDAALGQYQKSLAIFERIGSPNAKIVMGNIALIREKIGEAAFQELLASNLKELGHESVDSASGAS